MVITYSISDLAQECDVTPRTIRHYEDEGLLSPKREGHNRLFSNRDRTRLKVAMRAKRIGFSLSEVRELFNLYDSSRNEQHQLQEFLKKLERHRTFLEQQNKDIEIMLGEISFFETQCRKRLENTANGSEPGV